MWVGNWDIFSQRWYAEAADWMLYPIPSPIFREVCRVYSITPHIKGVAADRGGWVIGAAGKNSIP
jgi:hypothetical protein